MIRIQRYFALLLCLLAVIACKRAGRDTGFGFWLDAGQELELLIPSTSSDTNQIKERFLTIRHRSRPACLSGTIEPFGAVSAESYIKGVNSETDLSRKKPFLERKAHFEDQNSLKVALVRAFNEDRQAYESAYLGIFTVKKELWVAFIRWNCPEPTYETLARSLLYSLTLD